MATPTAASSSSSHNELSSFHAAFQADDTLITILPSFNSSESLPLLSSVAAGPFQAGMPTSVPLWMALLLHQRSLCTISPPEWLGAINLSEVIDFEKNNNGLFHDEERLPRHYYEIANRLTGRRGIVFQTNGASTESQAQVLSLLIQDLFQLRIDKLRQQLPAILLEHQQQENRDKINLTMTIDGISTQELALFRPFIQQALNDRSFLLETTTASKTQPTNKEQLDSAKASVGSTSLPTRPLRRFR
jgi:hypothetical protein